MSDALEALAWSAVATPSLDAPGSLDVLVDALLERGVIHEPWKAEAGLSREVRRRAGRRARGYLLLQAWEWAKRAAIVAPLVAALEAIERDELPSKGERAAAAFRSFRDDEKMVSLLQAGVLSWDQVFPSGVPEGTFLGGDAADAMAYATSVLRHGENEETKR